MKFLSLIVKNLCRNPVRTVLTLLAVICLVFLFSMIESVLAFLDDTMTVKSRDVKLVITERYSIPSRFDRSHFEDIVKSGGTLNSQLKLVPGFHEDKYTHWNFLGFTLDLDDPPKDKDKFFIVIATLPEKLPWMTDGLEGFDAKPCQLMKNPPKSRQPNIGILMGPDLLAKLKKKVGDIFPARSTTHRDPQGKMIEMQFEIVGALPGEGRWAQGAFIDYAYADRVLHENKHLMDGRINLGWLMVDDQNTADQVSRIIEEYEPKIKCEAAATATARFLAPFKPILGGVKYLLAPAIVAVITIIVANAIGITVRERTAEMAVLKVLGFGRVRILALVLGEALLVGVMGGLIGASATYAVVNHGMSGIKIPIAFFGVFFITPNALWWGPALGAATALLGGLLPAWNACAVKVSEVFAKVA